MTQGIYGLYSSDEDRWYVGASINIENRIGQHNKNLRKAVERKHYRHLSHPLGDVAYKFGIESIRWCILEIVTDKEMLLDREIYWANEKASLQNGYNNQTPSKHYLWRSK